MTDISSKLPVLLLTGMSGSGRSSALKTLEDMGYETIDNLPLSLLEVVALAKQKIPQPLAVSIDVRSRGFSQQHVIQALDLLSHKENLSTKLIFFDCEDETLARRYNETRRLHPLAHERPVLDGLRLERRFISPLRPHADEVIDTTHMTIADLKRHMRQHFMVEEGHHLSITVMSFSYRHGLPREADIVFDARLLKNPHYEENLRPITGEDKDVGLYIEQDNIFKPYMENIKNILDLSIARFEEEGRSYLTIAVGCTGGQHRSVFVAKCLAMWLSQKYPHVQLYHREINSK